MKKVYLSPSSQIHNAYTGVDTTECIQCNRIAEAAEVALKRCGIDVKRAPYDQDMLVSIRESNAYKPDLHIPIHTNAGGGQGPLVMVHDDKPGNMAAAQPIYDAVHAVTPGNYGYGIRARKDLAELNSTKATAVYIECEFHDRADLARWIVDNVVTLGEAIAKGVCKYFGVTYKTPGEPSPAPAPVPEPQTVNVYYRTATAKHDWLPEVKNLEDYAGWQDSPITKVAIRVSAGRVKYRVHIKGGKWLPYVEGYSTNDHKNGYAGNGQPIDAIEVYYYTPDDIRPYKRAKYRAATVGRDYYPWQLDNQTTNGQDGYAGAFGRAITRLQVAIV